MMWEYRARLIQALDGDTMRLLIDTGFHGRRVEDIRLLGVHAPELREPGGGETLEFVESWLADSSAEWPLRLLTVPNTKPEPEERRSFVRYLGVVTEGDLSLNAAVDNFLAGHPEWGPGE
jgi:hypothetical protein